MYMGFLLSLFMRFNKKPGEAGEEWFSRKVNVP